MNSSQQNPNHTFASDGTYTVSLTVTDTAGQSGSDSQSVSVSAAAGGDINLAISQRKRRGTKYADLTWSGANGGSVDIYRTRRGSTSVVTTANDGAYTDSFSGGGNATYKVCEAGTNNCSSEVSTTF